MSTYTKITDLKVEDVIEIGPGASWRTITDITEPTHPLAEWHGMVVIHTVLWGNGKPMRPLTYEPDRMVRVVNP